MSVRFRAAGRIAEDAVSQTVKPGVRFEIAT